MTCWNTYTLALREALHYELIGASNCLTPDVDCLLITSCSLTVRLLTFSASAVVLTGAFCLVCCRALAFLSATSFATCLHCVAAPPVASVLLLLKRFLDGLHLVFHLETRSWRPISLHCNSPVQQCTQRSLPVLFSAAASPRSTARGGRALSRTDGRKTSVNVEISGVQEGSGRAITRTKRNVSKDWGGTPHPASHL